MLSPWLVRGEFPLQCDARGFKEMNMASNLSFNEKVDFLSGIYIVAVSLILKNICDKKSTNYCRTQFYPFLNGQNLFSFVYLTLKTFNAICITPTKRIEGISVNYRLDNYNGLHCYVFKKQLNSSFFFYKNFASPFS